MPLASGDACSRIAVHHLSLSPSLMVALVDCKDLMITKWLHKDQSMVQ